MSHANHKMDLQLQFLQAGPTCNRTKHLKSLAKQHIANMCQVIVVKADISYILLNSPKNRCR